MYEVLEWIVNEQAKVPLDVSALKLRFRHVDPLLLVYADNNVCGTLTTYNGAKARQNAAEAFRLLQSYG